MLTHENIDLALLVSRFEPSDRIAFGFCRGVVFSLSKRFPLRPGVSLHAQIRATCGARSLPTLDSTLGLGSRVIA